MDKIALNTVKAVNRYISGTSGSQRIDRIHNALESMGKATSRTRDTKGGVKAGIRKAKRGEGFNAALAHVPDSDRAKYVTRYLN
jgi:hypothetical protein